MNSALAITDPFDRTFVPSRDANALVDRKRWFEFAEAFSQATERPDSQRTLCLCCRDMLLVSGVAITLTNDTYLAPLCVSDDQAAKLEDLQFTLGEGPTREASESGRPVYEPRLSRDSPVRWPALASLAGIAGYAGIFSFPIRVGAARIGVLTLYKRVAGQLSHNQQADALIAADALAHLILSIQAHAPAGTLAVEFRDAASFRAEIHQASGMLSEQVHVSVADALVRLRGRAYATDRPIAELARAVIARRLRLGRSVTLEVEWNEDT